VLKALTHRKLGHVLTSRHDLYALEDPLTSSVFGPLSHAPIAFVWSLFGKSVRPFGDAEWPELESGPIEWLFWPSWIPGRAGFNTQRVEPDLVLVTPKHVLILEMKHNGPQLRDQRAAQVSAARGHFPTHSVVHVAIGGTHHGDLRSNPPCASFSLPWRRLEQRLRRAVPTSPPHIQRIIEESVQALHAWGYRPRLELQSLTAHHDQSRPISDSLLHAWSPAGARHEGPFDALSAYPGPQPSSLPHLYDWSPT
jgi:hypothetical protein